MFFNRTSVNLSKESQRSLVGRIKFLTANGQHYSRHGGTNRSNGTSPDNMVVFQSSELAVSLARGEDCVDADCTLSSHVERAEKELFDCYILDCSDNTSCYISFPEAYTK